MMLSLALASSTWLFAGPGITQGISGMALVSREFDGAGATFLIVRDNKKPEEPRLGALELRRGLAVHVNHIEWPNTDLPIDLEAVSGIPGQPTKFIVMTSAGKCYRIALNDSSVTLEDTFDVPGIPDKANFEGMSLQKIGDKWILAWAHRGELPEKAKLFWTGFDPATLKPVGSPQSVELDVPWPLAKGSRGVSDLRIDPSGAVFITAAADFGDDGPFQSGLFLAGTLTDTFRPALMTRLAWFEGKKIEALEFVPGKDGGVVFGTDDENLGGSVWQNLWIND